MTQARGPTRRGVTLVESLLALALASTVVLLLLGLQRQARLEELQSQKLSAFLRARELLRRVLSDDLRASLPPSTLADEDHPVPGPGPGITLPVFAGYEGNEPQSLRFRRRVYRFDPKEKILYRDATRLIWAGLKSVEFRWAREDGRLLEVEMVADGKGDRRAEMVFLLPREDGRGEGWIPAPHHRRAVEIVDPVEL